MSKRQKKKHKKFKREKNTGKTLADMVLPPPGLDGSYRDSCVVCLRGTDTAFGVSGPAEAAIGVLVGGWGVDPEVAAGTLGCEPGTVPTGDGPWFFKLCESCAGKAYGGVVPVGVLPGRVPVISVPEDEA